MQRVPSLAATRAERTPPVNEPTAKTPGANAESSPLNLRAPHEVIARLTRVASKLPPGLFSKHRLAVIALEHGLAVIERDPMILLRGPVVAPVEPPSSPEVPAVVVAPAAPAPVARVERVERASPAAPAVASAPVVDTRQGQLPIIATVASVAPMSESAFAHMSLRHRYDDARDRHGFKHADAERALADAGVPVENLCRELAKPTAKWTAAHAAALTAMLDVDDGTSWFAPSEPAAAATPKRTRADDDALAQANEALRVHYRAMVAAKRITPREVWEALGDKSESRLRGWAKGDIKNVSAERLDAIKRVLNAKGVTA